ncbi:hypothetical protein NE237_023983 [Protea cynaroides]|uniref:RING-type domain-containing protein n=1 Tax=Protea cynaroides TaxID=273540 RepID=A0A9Q0HHY8_9MAGN|nr:hypothetical protein NE237_023983 [Protea cynaroides]
MSLTYDDCWRVETLINQDSSRSESQISMTDDQTSLPITFCFREVHLKVTGSNVQIIDSQLLQVKKKLFSFEFLSSHELLKPCIHDMLLNTDGFHISTDLTEPLKEWIAITVCDNFVANQTREVRSVDFKAEIQFQMVEECEDDKDTALEDIMDATMDIGPDMVPASKDSIEKLINTRKLEEDEELAVACTICLEKLGLEVKVMPSGHAFHGDCIIK